MKTKTKVTISSTLALAAIGMFSYVTFSHQAPSFVTGNTNAEIPYVQEASFPVVSKAGMIEASKDLQQLFSKADIVAEVQIKNQDTLRNSDTSVITRSNANIKKIYKGDTTLKQLRIAEDGGVLDLTSLKGNETRVDPNHPPEKTSGMVETTIEGSTVMKPNQKYIVFLYNSPTEQWDYTIVGAVQGKIKVNDADKLLATVDPKIIQENELFFLQKNYAGKKKTDLENALVKLHK